MSGVAAAEVTVADELVRGLEALGVRTAFGLPGVHNLAVWKALQESAIELIGVRHEQTAVYAADGQARVTGELGVAITTTGPGAANAIAATGEAWASRSPVLVITTDIPAALRQPGRYRGVLHETVDQAGMFGPVVKGTFRIDSPDRVADALVEAGELALSPPRAPVYVEVPADVLSTPAVRAEVTRSQPGLPRPSDEEVAAAVPLLSGAERPLIWVGRGAVSSGAGPWIERLAEWLAAPVIETFGARGAIPPSHPCWVGLSPHFREVGDLWDRADVVLAIGTNFDGTMTQHWAMPTPPHLISINIDPDSVGYRPELELTGDAAPVAQRVAEALAGSPGAAAALAAQPELVALGDSLGALRAGVLERLRREDGQAMALIDDLAHSVPAGTAVAADMCIAGYWVAGTRVFEAPSRLAYPIGWGTLGFAFPAAIGMALALGESTLCVCGDGGFLYACGELSVLAERSAPVVVLLVDDGGYGMLRYDQEIAGHETSGLDFPTADFVALAGAFGVPAERVGGLGAPLRRALTDALTEGKPRVLVLEAALTPPESTSPRWYRRKDAR